MKSPAENKRKVVRVGTRESRLAMLQTNNTVGKLQNKFSELAFEIVPVTTHGDKVRNKPLFEMGGRGVFVKELEEALLENEVDFVVHSLKDLPTDMPAGLTLAAVFDRTDPRDVLISRDHKTLSDLPAGSRVATSSRRRSAQIAGLRKDLVFVDIRGNIDTRLRKHAEGQCDAMILAAAGLIRLNLTEHISQYLDTETSLPAVGQAALAVECRSDDSFIREMLSQIDDSDVRAEITAERAFLDELGGGCSVPVGGLARVMPGGKLRLTACVCAVSGEKILREALECDLGDDPTKSATALGVSLADKMRALGAEELLSTFNQASPPAVSPP